jgi:hypothetical protein
MFTGPPDRLKIYNAVTLPDARGKSFLCLGARPTSPSMFNTCYSGNSDCAKVFFSFVQSDGRGSCVLEAAEPESASPQ